jgi:hypothetical protein
MLAASFAIAMLAALFTTAMLLISNFRMGAPPVKILACCRYL